LRLEIKELLIETFAHSDRPIGAVCHAPAVFRRPRGTDGVVRASRPQAADAGVDSPSMKGTRWRSASALSLALVGCIGGSKIQTVPVAFGTADAVEIDGITPCTSDSLDPGELDPGAPIVVLVHGCNDSAGRFTTLAKVFEAHGQQAICFTYESRDTIEVGAQRLVRALAELERRAPAQAISVIAHSQGGLVARRALSEALEGAPTLGAEYELVTISSPFAGIRAARHCSLGWLHVLSLGITAAICRGVAGRNWKEIHRRAEPVQNPGRLAPAVDNYVQIRTDERGSCRVRRENGSCAEDDFVFSLAEQRNPKTSSSSFSELEVEAGHIAIVGRPGVVPDQLVGLLQTEGIMNPTPPDRRDEISDLLRRLYGEPPAVAQELSARAPDLRTD
jgi:pimeloyl-ACP methyl ester carboxylesterase